MPFILVDLSHF